MKEKDQNSLTSFYKKLDLVIIDQPDFNNLELLSNQIKKKLTKVSDEIANTLKSV